MNYSSSSHAYDVAKLMILFGIVEGIIFGLLSAYIILLNQATGIQDERTLILLMLTIAAIIQTCYGIWLQKKQRKDSNIAKHTRIANTIVYGSLFLFILFVYQNYSYIAYNAFDQGWKTYDGEVCGAWSVSPCPQYDSKKQYEYWKDQSIEKNNPRLCNRVPLQVSTSDMIDYSTRIDYVNECKTTYAKETGNYKGCNTIRGVSSIMCLGRVAASRNMPHLVNESDCKIYREDDLIVCVYALAKAKQDKQYCELLDIPELEEINGVNQGKRRFVSICKSQISYW